MIPVHTAGEDDGVAYIAMRFVAGERSALAGPPRRAAGRGRGGPLVAQAGAALDAIHRAGFVHRDVKPANLLVDRDGHVYLTDFGLAKTVLTHSGGTRTGHWVGTLDYVSPEQIRGGRIDARADVYALGGVLHYALTGRVPFEREGDEAKLWAQLSAPPPVPSEMRRGLPAQFDVAVARAMAKDPDDRYPSAGDLGRAARAAAVGPHADRAGADGRARRRRAGSGADRARPGRGGLDPHRGAVPTAGGDRRRRARWSPRAPCSWPSPPPALLLLTRDDTGSAVARRRRSPTPTGSPRPRRARRATAEPLPRVVKTISNVGERPAGIALAGGDVWITSAREPRLTRVDAATDRERARRPEVGTTPPRSSRTAAAPGSRSGRTAWSCVSTARTGEVRQRHRGRASVRAGSR